MSLAAQYDKFSNTWASMLERHGFSRAYQGLFDRVSFNMRNKSVCDVGTGSGDFALALANSRGRLQSLTLVDPSLSMLDVAVHRLSPMCDDLSACPCRLEDLPEHQTFDVVLAAHVLEHCLAPQDGLASLFRLLKPGGILVLSVSKPHICQWLIWLRWRHQWFGDAQMKAMLSSAGFAVSCCYAYPEGIPERVSRAYVVQRPIESL